MKGWRVLLSTIVLGLGVALAAPQASAAETIEWRVQSLFPAGTSDYGVFRDYFVPLVEKMDWTGHSAIQGGPDGTASVP